ncbi:hypothetical protein BDV25DRAFT_112751 [Aspergillus avenaceus]|uniref:Nephrocystin 3-like N-terminal domain-containing protein n=1 Tax=Aspergillus avenaceus TaxID=36643 RepID=A0A5N6TVD9_ASPAV|nr:hypothetical protein BDV25DRAFT_112751 [Aspergillus avenaceus]
MQSEQRRENSDEQSDYSAIPSQSTSPMPQTFHNSASPYLSPNPTVPGFWVMPPYYEQRSYPPPALWPYPLSPAPTYLASCPQPQNTIVTGTWIKQLQMSGLDRRDIESIIEDGESIPLHYRSSAKDIIQAEEFRCWIAALNSTELLVLGNPGMDSRDAFLAISLVCAHLTQSVRQRGHGYLALAFFCSQHMDGDDAHASPHALMQSLLCQLLEQQQQNAHSHLLWNPRMQEAVEKGENLPILCVRFQGLVRQLPWDRTVMVVIDGASCYETERYETDMQVALSCLLGLARDPEVGPTFKVMVTCSTRTVSFHRLFAAQHAPLMLESLLPLGEDLDGFELHQDF